MEHLSTQPITNLTLTDEKIRARNLPFEDEAFTAICAWNVFACMPFVVARRYIRECYRVLSPTGIVHAIFLDADGRLDTRRNYRVADRQQLDVSPIAVKRTEPDWVEAELALMFSVFDACETKRAPCQTRELLAQRGPTGPVPFSEGKR
jgi:ubiquinone/menaquinone biosynthesis C-methylase UbiE